MKTQVIHGVPFGWRDWDGNGDDPRECKTTREKELWAALQAALFSFDMLAMGQFGHVHQAIVSEAGESLYPADIRLCTCGHMLRMHKEGGKCFMAYKCKCEAYEVAA